MDNTYLPIALALIVVIIAAAATSYATSKSSGPVLDPVNFKEFPLVEKTVISHNTALYRFQLPKTTDVLGLPIGQHVSIAAMINDKEIVRSYTPTSSDADKGYFDLLIKAYPTGNISKYIAELNIGEKIKVRGPKGFFNYTPGLVNEFIMVAGGTGITPMYQIIHAVVNNPSDKTKITLIYANVKEEDILMKTELDELAAKHDNLEVYYVLNVPPEGWTGGVGFVTLDILKEKAPKPADDVKMLLCGPPPMISSIKKSAVELGYQKAKPVSKLEDQVFAF